MRTIFMGTPDFAVGTLEAMIKSRHEVAAVVTQPDKPKGRGKSMQYTPVKETAVREHIPVIQPVSIKEEQAIDKLKEYKPDVIVVAAYGQILPESILKLPKYGCINVHASLLPKYRGAAPIQWAVINGERESGVTIMYMEKGLDTGDMLKKAVVPISQNETGGSLHDKLAEAGAKLLVEVLDELENGNINPVKQNDNESSYAHMLKKTLGNVDWNREAIDIERLIRGLNPWPSAYTFCNGKLLKLWSADIVSEEELPENAVKGGSNGQVIYVDKRHFIVKAGRDYLRINELQLEGKKRMETDAFLRGYNINTDTVLTSKR